MKLKGVLDFSLGNFLCLRGFAPMGLLDDLSEPTPSVQRDLLREHRKEMAAFLSQGEFLFFPEVILSTTLSPEHEITEAVNQLNEHVRNGESFANLKFDDFRISCRASRTKSSEDIRAYEIFQTATLELNKTRKHKFYRIDGNHRLSATSEDEKFRRHNTPYCLIFFRNEGEAKRLSRALFHNINYKQVPLTMEQNLKLIIEDTEDLFTDDNLKSSPSFGWPYYLTRKLNSALDLDWVPNLKPFIEKERLTFLLRQFTFLIDKRVLKRSSRSAQLFKEALGAVNSTIGNNPALKSCRNQSLLASLVYYELHRKPVGRSFLRWIIDNQLHLIESPNTDHELKPDFIQIFDKILESRNRTVFVSMKFGTRETERHYRIIVQVCKELTNKYSMMPPLKVERVDWFHDGTSYVIQEKITEMISDCGYLIANLTYANPNVYHEVGFLMGKAKAEGHSSTNILLFLDQSVKKNRDKTVGFNLSSIKQLRFTKSDKFVSDLKKNLEKFYRLVA